MATPSPSETRPTAVCTPVSSLSDVRPSSTASSSSLFHFRSQSQSTPSATSYLHPLQKHKVTETTKALIEANKVTGRKFINQYEVIEEIGRGMHGKVKLARNSLTGENVAIKIIPRFSQKRRLGRVTFSPEAKTRREIAILKKIRHENVVALLEVIDDPELKKIYMVLEHVELGEIVWRKKGLPHVCLHERRRFEREALCGPLSAEDERQTLFWEHRAALKDMRRIKIRESQAKAQHGDPWSLEHGPATGESNPASVVQSRIPSRDDLALLDSAAELTSLKSSVQASKCNSNAPSRSHSSNSVRHSASFPAFGLETPATAFPTQQLRRSLSSEMLSHAESALAGPSSFSIVRAKESTHTRSRAPLPAPIPIPAIPSAMAAPLSTHSAVESSFRGRSPSTADSFVSHMSSIDFQPSFSDPFVDDFSYVPCFTFDEARNAFRDTVLGLEYLHYQGVVHRDIKPANLLYTRDHRVKIADFGVSYFGRPIREGEAEDSVTESEACDFDNDVELAKTVGTPAFFAPELCYTDLVGDRQPGRVSEQIDVWSLGVTLYCLIFARIPFLAEDEFRMFAKIANEDVFIPRRRLKPVNPVTIPNSSSLYQRQSPTPHRDDNQLAYEDLDPDLCDLLQKILVKNPDRRIKLRDIKCHPWLLRDISNPKAWLADTDPGFDQTDHGLDKAFSASSMGCKIQVDERDMSRAVVPLTFLEFAKSVKSAVQKTVSKLRSPLGETASASAARNPAAAIFSGGEILGLRSSAREDNFVEDGARSVLSPPLSPTDSTTAKSQFNRRSLRGDENLPVFRDPIDQHHHLMARKPQLTSTSLLVASSDLSENRVDSLAAPCYDSIAAVHVVPHSAFAARTRESIPADHGYRFPSNPVLPHIPHTICHPDVEPDDNEHLKANNGQLSPTRHYMSTSFAAGETPSSLDQSDATTRAITHLFPAALTPSAISPRSYQADFAATDPERRYTPLSFIKGMTTRPKRIEDEEDDEETVPTLTRPSRRASYCRIDKDLPDRSQSAGPTLIANQGQDFLHSQPVTRLCLAVAPGSFQTSRLPNPRLMRSVDFECRSPLCPPLSSPPTYIPDDSSSQTFVHHLPVALQREERPQTAHRVECNSASSLVTVIPLSPPCSSASALSLHDAVLSAPQYICTSILAGDPILAHIQAPSNLRNEEFHLTIRTHGHELVGTCADALLTCPGEVVSPVSACAEQIAGFQSEQSLPALVSGASSVVSSDLEGDVLGKFGVLSHSIIVSPLAKSTFEAHDNLAIVQEEVFPITLYDNEGLEDNSDSDEGILTVKKLKPFVSDVTMFTSA